MIIFTLWLLLLLNNATTKEVNVFKLSLILLAAFICVSYAADVVIGPADGAASSYPFCGS